MKKTVLAATAALAIASASMAIPASAADLEFLPPPPPLVPTWQGFYVGGHVGYGEADFGGRFHPGGVKVGEPRNPRFSSLNPDGLVGGVQGGYNWQFDSWVLGIEGDVSFTDWRDRLTTPRGDWIQADVDLLASVRGRMGIAFDSLLLYGTGGIAFSDARARAFDFDTGTRGRVKLDNVGWVVGGGASWMVVPQTFSLGAEGLFYFFDDKSRLRGIGDHFHQTRAGTDYASFRDAWVVRATANFHF